MDLAATESVLRSRFEVEFPFYRPTVPWVVENEGRQEPDSSRWPSWVRWDLVEGGSRQVAIGLGPSGTPQRRYRTVGVVVVAIFVPLGSGGSLVRDIADDVATIYRGLTLSGVVCGAPRFEPRGPVGAWYQGVVVAPWFVDHVA